MNITRKFPPKLFVAHEGDNLFPARHEDVRKKSQVIDPQFHHFNGSHAIVNAFLRQDKKNTLDSYP
jgi:hypothetical protein